MIHFHGTSSKNNVEHEFSAQSYVDPCIFGSNPVIFLDQLKIVRERYVRTYGRPAVREMPKYILNDNLKVVIMQQNWFRWKTTSLSFPTNIFLSHNNESIKKISS